MNPREEQWENLYNSIKNDNYSEIVDAGGRNVLNVAIQANAPKKLILLLIEKFPDLITKVNPDFKNNSLHYLLSKPDTDHDLVKAVLKAKPDSFYTVNSNGLEPIRLIKNYSQHLKIMEDAIIQNNEKRFVDIFKIMRSSSILKRLIDDSLIIALRLKNKRITGLLENFKRNMVKLDNYNSLLEEELQKEKTKKEKEQQKKEKKQQKKDQIVEQEKMLLLKDQSSKIIQKHYRNRLKEKEKEQSIALLLKQKGLNKIAYPYFPKLNLPSDEEVTNPWKYDTTYRVPPFGKSSFGKSVLERDLDRLYKC